KGSQQVESGLLDGDGFAAGLAVLCHGLRPLFIPHPEERGTRVSKDEGPAGGLALRDAREKRAPQGEGLTAVAYHTAVPFIVGCPSALAVHSSMPASVSLAWMENSLPSNSG